MTAELPARLASDISETAFGKLIEKCAEANGWMHCHVRPLKVRAHGNKWITPTSQKGFPDYVLTHPNLAAVVVIEIKARGGKCTPEQKRWLQCLGLAAGVRTYAAWPEDWPAIRSLLEQGGRAMANAPAAV